MPPFTEKLSRNVGTDGLGNLRNFSRLCEATVHRPCLWLTKCDLQGKMSLSS